MSKFCAKHGIYFLCDCIETCYKKKLRKTFRHFISLANKGSLFNIKQTDMK